MAARIPWTLAILMLGLLTGLPAAAGAAQQAACTALTPATGNTICFNQAATTPTRSNEIRREVSGKAGYFDALDFGAKCDGVTDDSRAFAAAHTALPATGGTILLPSGRCLVKNWTISKSGVIIQGVGSGYIDHEGATILQAPNGVRGHDGVIKISGINTYAVTIRDVEIYGLAPNGADRVGVTVAANGTRLRLERVLIHGGAIRSFDSRVDGAVADSQDSGGIFWSAIDGAVRIAASSFRVEGNYFNSCQLHIEGTAARTGTQGVTIANNTFDSCPAPILAVGAVQVVRNLTIIGNRFSGAMSPAGKSVITLGEVHGVEGVAFIGNQIDGGIDGNPARAIEIRNGNGIVIQGNYFGGAYTGGTGAPILLTTPEGNLQIDGNLGGDVEFEAFKSRSFSLVGAPSNGSFSAKGIILTTRDGRATTIYRFQPRNNTSIAFKAHVLGRMMDTVSLFESQAAFYKTMGGSLTQAGATSNVVAIKSDPRTSLIFNVSNGTTVDVIVTGVSGVTYEWLADMEWAVR